ncbi:unnamed protein product [Oncorhynchus mykiss]|uniref:SH2 domain-containing protein n=1 Tax=Oncorhynchus mykiss TaxID=8022 RepID=A0A060WAN2_ONCMY|nr:unnamed protein product [Oncorhynchus mykiss]
MCRGTPTRQPFRPGSFLRNKKTLYAERIDPDLNHTSFDPCYCSGEALAGQIINTSSDICHSSPSLSSVLRLHVSNIAWIKVSHHSAATAVFAGATSFAVCPQEFRQQERKMSLHKERDNQMARALCTSSERFNADEIRGGRGPKEGSLRSLPLYDTPYEPAENGGDSDGERPRCPRESRLPQDDERPPEEYDQPWEWKKERISKAFAALLCSDCISYKGSVSGSGSEPETRMDNTSKSLTVQFEGAEKSRMSPTREGKGGRPPRIHSSCCLVNTKMSSLDHCSAALGERIDPSMSLESQFWYHGAISRTDAESLLRLCKEASYLVRNSETSKNDFSLSLKSSQGFMHMKLSRTKENKYILGQNSCPFDSVPEIIHFYSSRKLPIKGAEHMSLLYPVAIRTL